MGNDTHNQVKEYYGKVLKGKNDLKTSACCAAEAPPAHLREVMGQIADEVMERFYGCGSPIPLALEGCTVLDLGCGTGRDVFVCSALVGEKGHVYGVDMTDEQLEVARGHVAPQTARFGLSEPNVTFKKGYMEDLQAAGIKDNSIDVVISNCVINLSPNKADVFSEIFRVLKPGGELYFSDVFADRRLPKSLMNDPVLLGECLAGAMYIEDFRRMLQNLGVPDYRAVSACPISPEDEEIADKLGFAEFMSMTVRAFKLDSLEDLCEDYGQVARYQGTIPHAKHAFVLDDHHIFETGKPMLVCGNTAAMVKETRLGKHFQVEGDRSIHYGPFPCGPEESAGSCACDDDSKGGGCC